MNSDKPNLLYAYFSVIVKDEIWKENLYMVYCKYNEANL